MKKNIHSNNRYTLKHFFIDLLNDDLLDLLSALCLIILSPFIIIFSPVIKFFIWKKDYERNYKMEVKDESKKNN